MAIANNHYKIVNFLLESGANPDQKGSDNNTPLHFAARTNDLEILKLVAEWGIENKSNKETCLKTRINEKNEFGWSVLHVAASGITAASEYYKANWEVIKWLLTKGADISTKNEDEQTIEDIFKQEDWSYVIKYREIIKDFSQQSRQEIKINK